MRREGQFQIKVPFAQKAHRRAYFCFCLKSVLLVWRRENSIASLPDVLELNLK
jgi:hypothetical protein